MHSFIQLTHYKTKRSFTVALYAIGIIEPEEFQGEAYTTLVLFFGSNSKIVYTASESYQEVLLRIEMAQKLVHPLNTVD